MFALAFGVRGSSTIARRVSAALTASTQRRIDGAREEELTFAVRVCVVGVRGSAGDFFLNIRRSEVRRRRRLRVGNIEFVAVTTNG